MFNDLYIFMKQIISFLLTLMIIGCGGANKNNGMADEAASKRDTVSIEDFFSSSRSFFGDSIFNLNPELLTLYDSLYENVSITDSNSYRFLKKEGWMRKYSKKLSRYYDAHDLGSKNISVYAKADTVLKHIQRLVGLDHESSTMGMVVHYGTESKLYMCREYMLYLQLKELCKDKVTRNLVEREWKIYHHIYDEVMNFVVQTGTMNFWGGNIIGPFISWKNRENIAARTQMYGELLPGRNKATGDKLHGLQDAKSLLLMSCINVLDELKGNYAEYVEESPKEFPKDEFDKREKKARESIKNIERSLVTWIGLIGDLGEKLPGNRLSAIEQSASLMLVRWSEVLSDMWCE